MVTPALLAERYRIERQVGIGGMGTVFAAIDERLDREVAVKVLKEEFSSDERFIERFRREARAAAALSHPNVASVFDYGEDADRYFIVMELVEGRDLGRVMREDGPLGTSRALSIAEQIGLALGHAHAAGLIHRDVKPHNIIVMDEDRVKVTDFGIARAMGEATLTATGTIMGTAQYLSPEQASGEHPGPPSDVYSLGIVLFEMATGAVPFTGDSPISVALRHVREDVPAPSSIDPTIPSHVDELVATATAKQPDDRFPDGTAFAAAIRGDSPPATEEMTPTAAVAWPFASPPRWDAARLGRTVVVMFAALFLIALAALGYRLANTDTPQEAPARRDTSRSPARTQEPDTPSSFPLDDYRSQPADRVIEALEAAGLEPIPVFEECGQPKDHVCEHTPGPGETVHEGDAVTLVISTSDGEDGDEDDESGVGNKDKKPPGQEKKEEKDD